jgi:formate-dependent nitrite reductase membrane component NrfD
MSWVHVLWAYEQEPEKLSFRLFLTTGFLFHAFILEFANRQSLVKQTAYFTYISLSLSLGTLAYFNIISEAWIGLLLIGWMLPILFNALIDWLQKLKINKTTQSHTIDPAVRKNELNTRRIDVGAQIILGIGILSFLATKVVPQGWELVHLYMTFGVLLTAIVFIIMAEKNEPDLITLSKSRPVFSVLLALLFVGMICCLYLSSICGNYPFRKGGICVYSFIGIFVFPMLAVIVHWFYCKNWKPSKTIS